MAPKPLSPDLLPEVIMRAAVEGDVKFIVDAETSPENINSIGSWSVETHLANLSDPNFSYSVAVDEEDTPFGFAILTDLQSSDKAVQLQRIAVNARGHGLGRAYLHHVIDEAFRDHKAKRLWLAVFSDSEKAIRAYRRLGLIDEGMEKEGAFHNGQKHDVTTMAILDKEWADLHA